MAETTYLWPTATMRAGETKPVVLSAFNLCAVFWEPNEQWDPGELAWPTKPFGFVLEMTGLSSGRSGSKEPRWNVVPQAGAVVTDGSLEWTLRVPTLTDGIQPITNPSASPPAGITASALVVNENTKILVDYSGGTRGKSYEVAFTFDIAGRTRRGSQLVQVV